MGTVYSKEIETKWFDGFVEQLPDLQGKTIAITGCTTGLGYVFARTCIKKHATAVILLNRSSERAESAEMSLKEIANADTTVVETIACDLQDFASVQKAAAQLSKKYDVLDVLCNNAGIMAFPDEATVDRYDIQMQTNHLSHFLLTKELFPLLQKAKEKHGSARIVNHSSWFRKNPPSSFDPMYLERKGGQLGGNSYWAYYQRYHQSKLANAIFTCALQDRLEGTGIEATVAAPGYAATELLQSSQGPALFSYAVVRNLMAQSAEDGCMPLLAAAFMPSTSNRKRPMIWEPSGFMTAAGPAVEYELTPICTQKDSQILLWDYSEAACGKFITS
jgi:NAD(P)-dependent dehydrogenase (short-subunit alcohol dehydrogenase family)